VPPVLTHTRLGELYEEPTIVYIKVRGLRGWGVGVEGGRGGGALCGFVGAAGTRAPPHQAPRASTPRPMQFTLLEVTLGPAWYEAYQKAAGGDEGGGSGGRRAASPGGGGPGVVGGLGDGGGGDGPLWWWQRPQGPGSAGPSGAGTPESMSRQQSASSSWLWGGGGGSEGSRRASDPGGGGWGGFGGGGAPRAASPPLGPLPSGAAAAPPRPPPVFALARVAYGKHQRAESQPVRVSPGGRATFLESFCFTTKRCGHGFGPAGGRGTAREARDGRGGAWSGRVEWAEGCRWTGAGAAPRPLPQEKSRVQD
jgi:hypothetical protein